MIVLPTASMSLNVVTLDVAGGLLLLFLQYVSGTDMNHQASFTTLERICRPSTGARHCTYVACVCTLRCVSTYGLHVPKKDEVLDVEQKREPQH